MVEDLLEKKSSYETFYQEGGAYLPLSVWATKGFNIQDIVDGTADADIIEHPVLKTCYRVKILAKGTRGSDGWLRSSKNAVADKKRKLADAFIKGAVDGADAATKDNDTGEDGDKDGDKDKKGGKDDSDSKSSSSSSSSSSGSKHKKKKKKDKKKKKAKKEKKRKAKKAKKEKKDKKRAAKQEKDDKESKKVCEAKAKIAKAILEKLSPVKGGLQLILGRADITHLPGPVKDRVEAIYKKIDKTESACKKASQDPKTEDLPEGLSSVKDDFNFSWFSFYNFVCLYYK